MNLCCHYSFCFILVCLFSCLLLRPIIALAMTLLKYSSQISRLDFYKWQSHKFNENQITWLMTSQWCFYMRHLYSSHCNWKGKHPDYFGLDLPISQKWFNKILPIKIKYQNINEIWQCKRELQVCHYIWFKFKFFNWT